MPCRIESVTVAVHQLMGVARHMGAMKTARAEVHYAGSDPGRIIGRNRDFAGQVAKRGAAKPDRVHAVRS